MPTNGKDKKRTGRPPELVNRCYSVSKTNIKAVAATARREGLSQSALIRKLISQNCWC